MQTTVDGTLEARRQRAGAFGQVGAVEGEELGHIDDRVAGKTRRAGRKQDVAWGAGKLQVAGDDGDDDSLNAAAVEGICLDHQDRPPEAWFGPARRGKISPPDFAALKAAHRSYQEFLPRDLTWARSSAGSTFAGKREYTSFKRSVTALPCCRSRDSEIAVA